MIETVRILLLPACIFAALYCARRFPRFTLGLSVFLPVFSGALLAVLAATAMVENLSEVHRWTAHYYVIYLWLAVRVASAILLYQKVFDRPVAAFSQCVVLGSLIAIALLAGFTGYLPAQITDLSSETYRRFVLLHGIVLPCLLVGLQAFWLWFAWPCRQTLRKLA